jgi:hypothetical protein
MKALQLNDYSNLFRSDEAYREFVRLLVQSLDQDELKVIFADTEVVCTVVGPSAVRDIMQHRIIKRFAEQPDLLDELRERLEDGDLVD